MLPDFNERFHCNMQLDNIARQVYFQFIPNKYVCSIDISWEKNTTYEYFALVKTSSVGFNS